MTKLQRIANVIVGLLMIACGFILLLDPKNGLLAVSFILGLTVLLYGVRKLVYYLRMAHLMAGGLSVLFIAVIAIDIGIFAVAVIDNPKLAIALYLVCYNVLAGALAIARGIESKLFGAPWVLSIAHGLVNIALAGLCIAFANSDDTIIMIFCIGLFYNAGVRVVSALKPPEIIYIQ